jgi:type IV secretory pathway VirB3-like protein
MAPASRFVALTGALFAMLAGTTAEPALLVGALGTLVVAWAVASEVATVLPVLTGTGPVVAARDHRRALARRPVPRHRDPDAPGHIRSRAPSELLPAA